MDRLQEYQELISKSNIIPEALDDVVLRAHRRVKFRRIYSRFGQIAVFIVIAIGIFTISVNSSLKLAYAVGKIPILSDLAKKLTLSPSLKAAIDNEYVQPMNLSETRNGITVRVEYIIVDKKQVNIFYNINGSYDDEWKIGLQNNKELEYTTSYFAGAEEPGELRRLTIDIHSQNVPSSLQLQCKLYKQEGIQYEAEDIVAVYDFDLQFDPNYIDQGEAIAIEKWLELDGQQIYFDQAGIYPTHFQLDLKDNEKNTAWLKSLYFRIVDEALAVPESSQNGITALGSVNSPFMASHRLDSNYFSQAKLFQLEIIGAEWLDKDFQSVTINLESNTANHLPQGVQLMHCNKTRGGWDIVFKVKRHEDVAARSPFASNYCDQQGNVYSFDQWSIGQENQNNYILTLNIKDYSKKVIVLNTEVTRYTKFREPKIIKIKR